MNTTKLEPHVRIQRAGYEVSMSYVKLDDGSYRHRICITQDSVPVACEVVGRNAGFTLAELEKRIRRGLVSTGSDTYGALLKLADVADGLATERGARGAPSTLAASRC